MLVRLLCPFLHHPHLPPEVLLAPSGRWLGLDSSSISGTGEGSAEGAESGGAPACGGLRPRRPGQLSFGMLTCGPEASCAIGPVQCQVPGKGETGGESPCLPREDKVPPGASRVPQFPSKEDREGWALCP